MGLIGCCSLLCANLVTIARLARLPTVDGGASSTALLASAIRLRAELPRVIACSFDAAFSTFLTPSSAKRTAGAADERDDLKLDAAVLTSAARAITALNDLAFEASTCDAT